MTEDPGARWADRMRAGDWAAAWRVSDAVLAARAGRRDWTLPRHEQAVWDGTPPDGRRVLIRCYHGLGDTIQFARFLPRLAERAAAVTVWAQRELLPLLATMPCAVRLLPLHEGTPDVVYDVDIEVMELAHVFRITPETLPARVPYLHPPPAPRRARPGTRAVGLVWRAGEWDPRRSVPTALLAPLAAVPGVEWHILQRGPALAECPPGFGIDAGTDDVLALATRMRGLDLVVSVDSMPAHLAGALGVPVWLMLAHQADWRWMAEREDSPWYPTMRVFRQAGNGDWADLMAQLATNLDNPATVLPSGT